MEALKRLLAALPFHQAMRWVTQHLWAVELGLGAAIILLLVGFYRRYVSAATQTNVRIKRRRTRQTLHGTRLWLVILLLALGGVLIWDHLVL